MNDLHRSTLTIEWDTDSFQIPAGVLMRQCKEWARRQQREAVMFGQKYDVTAEKLLALYHRLRGRCAVLGWPLTMSKGPRRAELHHLVPVNRGDSVRQRCAGHDTRHGMVGMMSNITLVSRAGHMLLHWSHQYGIAVSELALRVSLYSERGSPCNSGVSLECGLGFYATQHDVDFAIKQMIDGRRFIPSVGDLFDAVRASGMHVRRDQIVQCLSQAGVDTRSYIQKQRVAICCDLVRLTCEASPDRSPERIVSFVVERAPAEYQVNGMSVPSPKQISDDAKVAIKQVLGIDLFRSRSASDRYNKRKAQIWTKKTPARLSRVYHAVKRHGKTGVSEQSLCDELLCRDPMRGVESYKTQACLGVMGMVADLQMRRLVDVVDGVVTARLLMADAARYCGYTANTLKQFCKGAKGVIGPASEMAAPGKGHAMSFSFLALDEFLDSRIECRKLRPVSFAS